MRCQTYGYLPGRRASPPFGWYQIELLGDRGTWVLTTCPELLPCGAPGVEPATYRSRVQHANHYTTKLRYDITRCLLFSLHAQIFNSFPLENWCPPPGRPHTTWMKSTQQGLKSMNLSLNEATDVVQNRPFWRLMSTFGTIHS